MTKKQFLIALVLVLSLATTWVGANLQIETNMENAVQTIKRIIITDDGTASGTKLLELNPAGVSEGSTEVLKVRGNIIIGETSGAATNIASGTYSTVAGGQDNRAIGMFSAVLGGMENYLQANRGSIGGGKRNTVSADYATIPGGYGNNAEGLASFAAGNRAQALHTGTFVWSDSQNNSFSSTTERQFLIRAQNGVGINTNSPIAALQVSGSVVFGNNTHTGNLSAAAHNSILGGEENTIGGTSQISSIVGGGRNTINESEGSTIAGGIANQINGSSYATIAGGSKNKIINAPGSFVAGRDAQAYHTGSFVRSSDPATMGTQMRIVIPFKTTAEKQFLIRASNGVAINTNISNMGVLTLYGAGDAGGIALTQGGTSPTARMYLKNDNNFYITRGGQDANGLIISASGAVAIGDLIPATGLLLDVAGKVGAEEYCDGSGANCFESTAVTSPSHCSMTVISHADQTSPVTKEVFVDTPKDTNLLDNIEVYYNGCSTRQHSFCMLNVYSSLSGQVTCRVTANENNERILISTLKSDRDMCGVSCVGIGKVHTGSRGDVGYPMDITTRPFNL